jgi:predicted nucleotidyltransferase
MDSDLDFLVDFRSDARIGLFEFSRLQHELELLLQRQIDLVPKRGLKPGIRDNVLRRTQLVYAG